MKKQSTIIILDNPLRPYKPKEKIQVNSGFKIQDKVKEYNYLFSSPVVCFVNGEPILRKYWNTLIIKADDVMCFQVLLLGGDGTRETKNPLLAVAGLALAVYGAAFSTGFLGGAMTTVGVGLAAAYGGFIDIPRPLGIDNINNKSPTYSGRGNLARIGDPIPVIYGRTRIYPDLAMKPRLNTTQEQQDNEVTNLNVPNNLFYSYELEYYFEENTSIGPDDWDYFGGSPDYSLITSLFLNDEENTRSVIIRFYRTKNTQLNLNDLIGFVRDYDFFPGTSGFEIPPNYIELSQRNVYNYLYVIGQGSYEITDIKIDDASFNSNIYNKFNVINTSNSTSTNLFKKYIFSFASFKPIELKFDNTNQFIHKTFQTNVNLLKKINKLYLTFNFPNGYNAIPRLRMRLFYSNIDNIYNFVELESIVINENVNVDKNDSKTITFNIPESVSDIYDIKILIDNLVHRGDDKPIIFTSVDYEIESDFAYKEGLTLLEVQLNSEYTELNINGKLSCIATQKTQLNIETGNYYEELTQNPVNNIVDVIHNPIYGLGIPLDKINIPELVALNTRCREKYRYFNYIWDRKTNVWEVLETMCKPLYCKPIIQFGKIRLIEHKPMQIATSGFSDNNMIKDSYSVNYKVFDDNSYNKIIAKYKDTQLLENEIIKGTGNKVLEVDLKGVVYEAQADAMAQYIYNNNLYSNKTITFQTELEGLIPNIGDLISVSNTCINNVIPTEIVWGRSSSIKFAISDEEILRANPNVDSIKFMNLTLLSKRLFYYPPDTQQKMRRIMDDISDFEIGYYNSTNSSRSYFFLYRNGFYINFTGFYYRIEIYNDVLEIYLYQEGLQNLIFIVKYRINIDDTTKERTKVILYNKDTEKLNCIVRSIRSLGQNKVEISCMPYDDRTLPIDIQVPPDRQFNQHYISSLPPLQDPPPIAESEPSTGGGGDAYSGIPPGDRNNPPDTTFGDVVDAIDNFFGGGSSGGDSPSGGGSVGGGSVGGGSVGGGSVGGGSVGGDFVSRGDEFGGRPVVGGSPSSGGISGSVGRGGFGFGGSDDPSANKELTVEQQKELEQKEKEKENKKKK